MCRMSRCEKTETRIQDGFRTDSGLEIQRFSDRAQINKHTFEREHLSSLLIFTQTCCTPDDASGPGRVDLDQGSLARLQNKLPSSGPCGFPEGDHLFCWCLGGVPRVLPLCVADTARTGPRHPLSGHLHPTVAVTLFGSSAEPRLFTGATNAIAETAIIPHMIDIHRPSHNLSVQCISDTHPGFRTLTAAIRSLIHSSNSKVSGSAVCFCILRPVRLRFHSSQVRLMTAVAVTTLV